MSIQLGIGILDLLPQTTALAPSAPDDVIEKIAVLTIVNHRATGSDDFFLHDGVLQSPADALDLNDKNWGIRVPGLTHGLPFRLAVQRVAATSGQQEAKPALWTLDIEISDVEVEIPRVRAAKRTGGDGVAPLTLVPTGATDVEKRVYLVGRGVLRISGGGTDGTQVQVVDTPDPFDPGAPTGAVIHLTAQPPHFMFGDSQYGATLDQLDIDLSSSFTPAAIEARGHDETWRGIALRDFTFYFPPDTPVVHSLSIGARDVIVGSPGGLQGELRLEFGEDVSSVFNTHITVKMQQAVGDPVTIPPNATGDGSKQTFPVAAGNFGRTQRVQAIFTVGAGQFMPGSTDTAVVGIWWKLPDGTEGTSAATPFFDAPTDATMLYRLRIGPPASATNTADPPSQVPEDQNELAEITVAFPLAAGSPTGVVPVVDMTVPGGDTYRNILHLRGPRERLQGLVLTTRDNSSVKWLLGEGGVPNFAGDVPTVTLPLLREDGKLQLLVGNAKAGARRIRIDVVPKGPLAVSHQSGTANTDPAVVTVVGTGDALPAKVVDTFLAKAYRLDEQRSAASTAATISGTLVTVPQGCFAEVSVPVPAGAADPLPDPPTPPVLPRAVQILYEEDSSDPVRVVYPYDGPNLPDAPAHQGDALPMAEGLDQRAVPTGNTVSDQIGAWITALGTPNGRKFFVVGRADDLRLGGTLAENTSYNDGLALSRANAARDVLTAHGISAGDIVVRAEQHAFATSPPADVPARFSDVGRLALPTGQSTTPPGQTSPAWNKLWSPDGATRAAHQQAAADPHRPPYRCSEIYAVDTAAATPPPPPPPVNGPGVPVRMLVPGPEGDPSQAVPVNSAKTPPTNYRVRLRVKWDSPTIASLADAIPSEAEALVAWKSAQVEFPAASSGTAPTIPPPTGSDIWQLLLGWTFDARTGETEASGALSLPDGTLTWTSDALAGALAFGPAVTALIAPADSGETAGVEFAAAAAILAIGAGIGELINPGSGPDSSVDIDRFAIQYKWNGASQVAATVDYTVDLRVNVSVSGAGDIIGRLKLRYKGVGLRFDGKPGGGLAGVALTYDGLSVEVVDPGTWSLGGPLGQLIRIVASRMGNGSQWLEFDLGFAIDLGVVTLEGATIRLVLDPFAAEFRGLTASLDIPDTIKGKGSITIGDGGSFRALLALDVIPAKLGAYGALAVDQDFVSIEVGIQLPVGLPLGGTGFGIFGFVGRFVANGTRDLTAIPSTITDPVQKQLAWYALPPQQKYKRQSGQYAFGVGAIVGTLPDGAFTFNAEGALTVGFPDVSVIFGIDAHLITSRKSPASAQGSTGNDPGNRILGMVLIEPDSIMLAVRATYQIPKVLKVDAPISAFFPLAGGDPWYIRIGSDNAPSRPGNPVTITLLPGLLDIKAWAFVMIEERGLLGLGGTLIPSDLGIVPLDFDGFSIGMGAGFDLKYSAGPFSVEVTAFLVVGVGTKPLLFSGAAGVKGELDLVVVSVGVDGVINFHISPSLNYVEAHFCGHVDCFFFDISGCVKIHIGDDPPSDGPPVPDSPLLGIDLCDHLAVIKGKANRPSEAAGTSIWPDTVAVLRFSHYVEDALGTASDFDRKVPTTAALSPWSGSTELKYAFRLTSLELWKLTGGDPGNDANWTRVSGPFDSAWWLPTHRGALVEGGTDPGPSSEEGRELGLFSWDPRAWSRWLGEGSQDVPGDPSNGLDGVCDPPKPADPACAYGRDWTFGPFVLGAFKSIPEPGAAFPSRFTVLAELPEGIDTGVLSALGADAGWVWLPGAVAPLHPGITLHGETLSTGWRFPSWRSANRFVTTAPIELRFSTELLEGELVLEVCADPGRLAPSPCDPMPDKDGTLTSFSGAVTGTRYSGRSMEAFALNGERALRLNEPQLNGAFTGTTDVVSIEVDPGAGKVELIALDSNNKTIGQAVTDGKGRGWIRVAAPGITHIVVRADGDKPTLFEICWGARPAVLDLIDLTATTLPVVTATDVHGKRLTLTGEVVSDPPPPAAIVVTRRCPKLRFALPKGDGWTRVEVAPWSRGDVSLVACCGTTVEAGVAQAADGAFRDGLFAQLFGLVQAANTDPSKPTHNVYLEAHATYEIRASWQWQGFQPAHPGDAPPSTASGTWQDAPAPDRFRFSTSAFGLSPPAPPVQQTSLDVDPAQGGPGYDERTFDPRGITRYLTRSFPTHEDPPHFLDDAVGFWFMVDHLEALVEKYERILQVKVLATRPPVGSLHDVPAHVPGTKHPLDVTIAATWKVDRSTWFDADRRFVDAAAQAPCIGGDPPLGSSTVSVTADLKPRTEYDLLLNAAPQTVNAFAETPIARSHFRTSRYRNPGEMLLGLGFAPAIGFPTLTDAIVGAPLAPAPLEIGDTALDAALTALGLDPWPLPAAPRTTLLWLRPASGQPWMVAGVLIEADEPVWREGFSTGAVGEPAPPPRVEVASLHIFRTHEVSKKVLNPTPPPHVKLVTTTVRDALGSFAERVRNAAGTRSLFVPAAPIVVTDGRLYDLALQLNENGAPGATGIAPMADRPMMILQEGE